MELSATLEKKIHYRLYTPEDEEGMMRLWKEDSGWGEITAEQFRQWFLQTPNGETISIVAVDEDQYVHGQVAFTPTHVVVNGKVIKSLRGAAPILDGTLRQASMRSLSHPAFELFRKGLEVAKGMGFQLAYAFPAHGWVTMLRLFPQILPFPSETLSLNCFSVDLSDPGTWPGLDEGFRAVEFRRFSAEHEGLWNRMVSTFPVGCAIDRKLDWLQWTTGSQLKVEIRSTADDRLTGYACIKRDSGLVTDIVAPDATDLRDTYLSLIRSLHTTNPSRIEVPFDKLKGMITPEAATSLHSIDYAQDNYQFAFAYILLDEEMDSEAVHSSHWYLTPLG